MRYLKKHLFYLSLYILIYATSSTLYSNAGDSRAIWVWKSEQIFSDKKFKNEFFKFIEDLPATESKVSKIFLYTSFDILRNRKKELKKFVSNMRERGYEVEALNGDPNWAKHHSTPLAFADAFMDYQDSVAPEERLSGLQFDIEPHVLGIYGIEEKRKVIHEQYLVLLKKVRLLFRGKGLNSDLGIAVPVAYSEDYAKKLFEHVDYLAVMDYFDSSRTINHYAKKFIYAAEAVNAQNNNSQKTKKVYIGIETQIPNDRWGVGARNTFFDEGYNKMEQILSEVIETFNGYPSFAGIAVHDYNAYTLLPSEKKPLIGKKTYPSMPNIYAKRIDEITIDGSLDDWEMSHGDKECVHLGLKKDDVVYGVNQWKGREDYNARISFGWDNNYLYLGLSIIDDKVLQQATGVDMLNGDHIEILIDYDLEGDKEIKVMNDDDFQIGISPGNFDDVGDSLAYWFPEYIEAGYLEKIDYSAQKTTQGYNIEVAIPWVLSKAFQPKSGQALRINIDPSDTDRNPNYQETLLSTSPHREHANPRTFRTLILN